MELREAFDLMEDELHKLQFICDVAHAVTGEEGLTPEGEDGFYLILSDSRDRIEEASDRIRKIVYGP